MELLSRFDWLIIPLCITALLMAEDRWLGFPCPPAAGIIVPWLGLPMFVAIGRELGFWAEAGLWVLQVFTGLTGLAIWKAAKDARQQTRDDMASAILKALRSSTPLPTDAYALYARPFSSTDQLTTQNMDMTMGPGARGGPTHIDLETKLTCALERWLPVMAMGRAGEIMGAGRVEVSESEWREAFALLAAHAALILVLPSSHPGTRWEMDWLLHGARDRCIFIMPMSPTERLSYSAGWKLAEESMAQRGIELPPYDSGGALFRLESDGHPVSVTPLPGWPVIIPSLRKALVAVAPAYLGLNK